MVGDERIAVSPAALAAMRSHAGASYPEECCGGLLGRDGGSGARVVERAAAVGNAKEAERERRYLIGPDEVRALERAAERDGLVLLGFYHSHPDHPAEPSVFDRDHAWPWYTYIIVPVAQGSPGVARAWRLSEDREGFTEQQIRENEER